LQLYSRSVFAVFDFWIWWFVTVGHAPEHLMTWRIGKPVRVMAPLLVNLDPWALIDVKLLSQVCVDIVPSRTL
jgi:hypothetical protein